MRCGGTDADWSSIGVPTPGEALDVHDSIHSYPREERLVLLNVSRRHLRALREALEQRSRQSAVCSLQSALVGLQRQQTGGPK